MITRVYIDTSVFIWAYNFPGSNSDRLLDFLIDSDIELVVSEIVVNELRRYFCAYYSKDVFSEIHLLLFTRFTVIYNDEIEDGIAKWRGKIKDKDLEHLVIAKEYDIPIIIAYDEDFDSFPEYKTPKEFIISIGLKPSKTEY